MKFEAILATTLLALTTKAAPGYGLAGFGGGYGAAYGGYGAQRGNQGAARRYSSATHVKSGAAGAYGSAGRVGATGGYGAGYGGGKLGGVGGWGYLKEPQDAGSALEASDKDTSAALDTAAGSQVLEKRGLKVRASELYLINNVREVLEDLAGDTEQAMEDMAHSERIKEQLVDSTRQLM